jgi:ubiquinone/menaquinone biosynthesis C-methylase UbiE
MGPADLVLMSHIIEHLYDLKKFLLQMRKILKPKGISLVITPGVRTFGVRILGLKPFLLNMHLTYFSLGTLTMVMGAEGFSLQVGDESIFALFRKEEHLAETQNLRGDPELSGFLQMSRNLRPLWIALWPAWKVKNSFLAWKRNRNSRI